MSTAATTVTPAPATPAPAPAGNTIHDAVEALFAEKAAKPAETPAPSVEQPTVEVKTEGETIEQPVEGNAPPADDKAAEPAPEPKLSAAEYAVQLARTRKKLAVAEAAASAAQKQSTPAPSAEAIKRAAAIEAAGGDPLKAFEAAGFDLATVVQAYNNKSATDPEYTDPLAKEVKELRTELQRLQQRETVQRDAESEAEFMRAAETRVKASEEFEYVAAKGQKGLELVKELVLQAANGIPEKGIPPRVMPLAEALKEAEAFYSEELEPLAQTKKLAKKFQTSQTRKPGIAQQSPTAGTAPATQTKPKSVRDVINQELDALMG